MAETAHEVALARMNEKIEASLPGLEEEPEEERVVEPVIEGDDDPEVTEEAPETEEAEETKLFDVEIDGQIFEVPEALKDAVVMGRDYTKKTQDVALQAKEYETITDAVQLQHQQYQFMDDIQGELYDAKVLDWQIAQLQQYKRDNIDSLSGQQIEKVRFQVEEMELQKKAVSDAVTKKYTDFQQAHEQVRKGLMDKSTEVLRQKIPGWDDGHVGQMTEFGVSIGFTEAEIQNSIDPRERQVLWMAAQFARLQQGKAAAVKKVKTAPTIRTVPRDTTSVDVKRKGNIRKALDAEPDPKKKAKIIEQDFADRLNRSQRRSV